MRPKYYFTQRTVLIQPAPEEEPSKPFYKSPSDLIALAAILLSIFTIIYTTVKDNSSEHEAKNKEMRENVASLLLLEKESANEAELLHTSVEAYIYSHPKLQIQIEILLDNINVLNEATRKDFSTEFYNYIAFIYYRYSSRSNRTFKYYEQSLEVAKDALDTSNVYMGLFLMHYENGLYYDTIKAHEYLQKDIQLLQQYHSDYAYFYISKDFATAAEKERDINSENCFRFLDSAHTYARTFAPNSNMYDNLKTRINEAIRNIKTSCNEEYCTLVEL